MCFMQTYDVFTGVCTKQKMVATPVNTGSRQKYFPYIHLSTDCIASFTG